MGRFIFRRTLVALGVALTVSIISFLLLHLSGDLATAIAGPDATAAEIARIRVQFGLDQPMIVQFYHWFTDVLQLDFGQSYYYQSSVLSLIADRLALLVAVIGQAMPSFWFGLALIILFAVQLQWLPAAGHEGWQSFILPAIALGYYATPAMMRLTRAGMLEVLESDYIRTARAKGLRTPTVIFKHALRNAIIPVVALAAVELGFMLGGSVVIESVFSLQGLGQLAWDSISRNDFPVVQAVVLIIALFYIALTLLSDILNAMLDPRLRVG
ncbi:peptide/nickel transport system permease protein [Kushneria sinocarnis]|uniref:Peptide/nickel transport system permease protein n=1 Tax=Kushneria sinocarnis TaxID=595502 RepID=A0A420WZY3_9GAMM|nr:ABC transporter permease [Kushneria sinocarnis]RKR06827.1 peptide/nickel transport system permease protein [Kushneria sinocarnis]